MKKLLFIFCLLFITNTTSFAQDSKPREEVFVRYGDCKTASGTITREEFLANTVLTVRTISSSCEVASFTFGMFPKGKDFWGPFVVKGAELTREIKAKIQEMEDPQARIFIEGIKVKCDGREINTAPIVLNLVASKK